MGGGGSLGSEGHLESVRPAIRWDPQKVCPSPGRGTGRQLESRLWDKVSLEVTRWSGAERGMPRSSSESHTPPPPGESSLGSGTLAPSRSGLPRLLCPLPPGLCPDSGPGGLGHQPSLVLCPSQRVPEATPTPCLCCRLGFQGRYPAPAPGPFIPRRRSPSLPFLQEAWS